MPRSFDPYLGLGFRLFVDFLFTQSISRLALVVLWALVGMLLADIAPNVWRDSGLRHLYRQVRKDVRHVKRSVPRIRIENDLPSVRLFNPSRSTSSEVPRSLRSDIAAPSRSTAPSPAPTSGPARRPGRSPPGTYPDVSGWSETATNVSVLRERRITSPGPSPALIPSQEHASYDQIDIIHTAASQARTTTIQNTTTTITQTRNESVSVEATVGPVTLSVPATSKSPEPIDAPLRPDPPPIYDDWVDINHPTPAKANEPVAPFQPDPDSTPEAQPGPSTLTPPQSASILPPPPAIDVPSDIPNIDPSDRVSQFPDQIPLPESRAASVIGGVYDQPQPRNTLRDHLRSRVDKATSEIGVDPAKSLARPIDKQQTKSSSSLRSWFLGRSKNSAEAEAEAPAPPPKETSAEPAGQSKLDAGGTVQAPEPQIPSPAQVDPPASILTQPGDTSSLLLAMQSPQPKQQQVQGEASIPDPPPASAGVDSSPALPLGQADKKDTGPLRTASLFGLPSPTRSPPPPFTEFAGDPEGPAAGGAAHAEEDPATQDEAPTELTGEQKAAEEKRLAFLSSQVKELERSRADLQRRLDNEDEPTHKRAKDIKSDLEDTEKTLGGIEVRLAKKKFSGELSPYARIVAD